MTVFNVSSAAELQNALKQATGGDEIRLDGGDYGLLRLDTYSGFDVQYDEPLKIVSADPNDPASFSSMYISGANNVTLDGLNFEYEYESGDPAYVYKFKVQSSSNIVIQNSEFVGDTVGGDQWGTGLFVRQSSDVTVENNEFRDLLDGASFTLVDGLDFIGNDLEGFRRDATVFSAVHDVLIEDNYYHDFDGKDGSHRDMIQFLSMNKTEPSTDVTIRGNTFDIAEGSWTQSIFIRNEEVDLGRAGEEMYYQNFLIEENVIYNNHTHGITVGETDGLIIRNNTVLYTQGNPDDPTNKEVLGSVGLPEIRVSDDSKNVTIENNVTTDIVGYEGQKDWSVSSNVILQPSEYSGVFSSIGQNSDGSHYYVVAEGSVLDTKDAGATRLQPEYDGNSSVPSDEPTAPVEDKAAPVEETTAPEDNSSQPVEEPSAPVEEPSAPVEEPSAPVEDATAPVDDGGEADFDFAQLLLDGRFVGGAHVETSGGETSVVFDGSKDYVKLGRLEEFQQSEQLTVSIEYAREFVSSHQERLVWNHEKFGLALEGDGLRVMIANTDGPFWQGFKINDLGLDDTDTHNISVAFDVETDNLQVVVDGDVVFETDDVDLEGVTADGRDWGWTLGSQFGHEFAGEISDFSINDQVDFIDPVISDYDAGWVA